MRWRDVTAQLGEVRWPRQAARTFESREQLARELRRVQSPGARVPAVDFSRSRLVLAAAGPRSSSGYGVRVLDVVERRGRVDVDVGEIAPLLGESGRSSLTFPYRLIALPASDKPVFVRWEGHG